MRLVPLALLACLVGCGPKVDPQNPSFDDDLGGKRELQPAATTEAAAPVPVPVADRPLAPSGKGVRSGTIERARLIAVLDSGPGAFLRQLEVTPRMDGERFVGWQLVQLIDRTGPLVDVDVAPGDVLLAINGKPISRPDQLETVWESLRTANELDADLWRGKDKLRLSFTIDPPSK
jgi:S1-C subfamily serine protease